MDWGTIVSIIIGAVITLISTFSATAGIELFREKRQVKQKNNELEDERIRQLQNRLNELTQCIKALNFEYSLNIMQQDSRRNTQERLVNDIARHAGSIAITATRITDPEARSIGEAIREQTRELVHNDRKKFGKLTEEFNTFAIGANEQLGAVIRRRME